MIGGAWPFLVRKYDAAQQWPCRMTPGTPPCAPHAHALIHKHDVPRTHAHSHSPFAISPDNLIRRFGAKNGSFFLYVCSGRLRDLDTPANRTSRSWLCKTRAAVTKKSHCPLYDKFHFNTNFQSGQEILPDTLISFYFEGNSFMIWACGSYMLPVILFSNFYCYDSNFCIYQACSTFFTFFYTLLFKLNVFG